MIRRDDWSGRVAMIVAGLVGRAKTMTQDEWELALEDMSRGFEPDLGPSNIKIVEQAADLVDDIEIERILRNDTDDRRRHSRMTEDQTTAKETGE